MSNYTVISTGKYEAIISERMDELPEAFSRELNGDVIMSEALMSPERNGGKGAA